MRRLLTLSLLTLAACLMPSTGSVALTPANTIAIIISTEQAKQTHKVARGKLKLIYLRKQRYWPEGVPI